MPLAVCPGSVRPQPLSIRWPEPRDPAPDRLVGNLDSPLGKQLLNIAKAEGEPAVQPNGVLDDGRRKVAVSIADLVHMFSLAGVHPLSTQDS